MCIKLYKNNKFRGMKRTFLENGISVNFTEENSNFVTAFPYVNKCDTEVLLSDSHPDLELVI